MKKRLRKKKHLGEYREWGCQIVITRNRKEGFDEFLDAFIGVVETNKCWCGGGGKEDKLDVFVVLGRAADDPEAKLQKIIERLASRPDVESWQAGKLLQ